MNGSPHEPPEIRTCTDTPPGPRSVRPASTRRGVFLFIVGLLLLIAALWAVSGQRDAMHAAIAAARSAPWPLVVAVLMLPLANYLVISLMFWALTRRYAPVRLTEMFALIGSSWLLNYLPMRPGMVGRIAYHKAVHGIRVRDSARILLWSLGATVFAAIIVLGIVLAIAGAGPVRLMGVAVALAVPTGIYLRWRTAPDPWIAVSLRLADMCVWTVRYVAAFALIGHRLDPLSAVVIAAASQAAMVVPIQLGVREWIVGVVSAGLPGVLASIHGVGLAGENGAPATGVLSGMGGGGVAAGAALAPGLMAEIANRCAELVWAIPIGTVSVVRLIRTKRALPAGIQPPERR
ncbi:MAG: hypothetical protein H7Y88_03115 [Phycisphaerales bacterium]|nr:hypothetical protein [Phycisphaerales bacterium]